MQPSCIIADDDTLGGSSWEMTIRADISRKGLRPSRAREVILELLRKIGCPITHQEMLDRLEEHAINRVTVYRTLSTLKEAGLIHRIQGVDGVWRYSAHAMDESGCPGNHPHLLCLVCGRMTCMLEQPLPWVEVAKNFEIVGKQFIVYGRCGCTR